MNIQTIQTPHLGSGIYTVTDIARILQLPTSKVRYCLKETWDNKLGRTTHHRAFSSPFGKARAVDFNVLIEFYIYFQLRQKGLSAQSILKAHKIMSEELNTLYPFASHSLLTDGRKILYYVEDTTVNADGTAQTNFTQIVESFCKKIDFNGNTIAQRLWPRGKESSIVVDPHHQFGLPVIDGTNINAQTISEMFESGEKAEMLSYLFDLTNQQVRDAVEFYHHAA